MTARKTRQIDDETIIAKYNECNDSYDEWDTIFKMALLPVELVMWFLIYIYLVDGKNSASNLLEIRNALISITDYTFAIIVILTFIALIFSIAKSFRYLFWAIKFKKLEEERRQ